MAVTLQDLELFLHKHSDSKQKRLVEVAQQLIKQHIMILQVRNKLQEHLVRSEQLQENAKNRTEMLENAIQEAHNRESQMLEFSQWVGERYSIFSLSITFLVCHKNNEVSINIGERNFKLASIAVRRRYFGGRYSSRK